MSALESNIQTVLHGTAPYRQVEYWTLIVYYDFLVCDYVWNCLSCTGCACENFG